MKIRILTDGNFYRLQKRFLFFWFNIDPYSGQLYHPEQMVHFGHLTLETLEEAILAKEKLEKQEKESSRSWNVVKDR